MVRPGCELCPCPQVFTLPKVSAKLKLKLTALEGSRVRRVSVAHFGSCRAEDYGEHHLAVLTNLGDVQVVSLPLLKPQVRYSCIRREDVSGIASCVFTKYGQGGSRAGAGGPLLGSVCGVGVPPGSQAGGTSAEDFEGGSSPSYLLWGWGGGGVPSAAARPRNRGPALPARPLLPPPAGFYLISPSEFERFSLSTKWLVEPRCLVDSAETKSHSRPRNGSGPEKALDRTRSAGQVACGWPEIPLPGELSAPPTLLALAPQQPHALS